MRWPFLALILVLAALFIHRLTRDVDSGAQVTIASFAVFFLTEQGIGISQSRASTLFSLCQITFTIGR